MTSSVRPSMPEAIMGTGEDGTTTPVGATTRESWGNTAWVAGELFEDIMRRWLMMASNVMELGSGWTTIVLNEWVHRMNGTVTVTSLENLEMWYNKVVPEAPNVNVILTPLVDWPAGFTWYSIVDINWTDAFPIDLLLVDGPPRNLPGHDMPEGRSMRYGALPALEAYLAPGCIIIVDDMTPEYPMAVEWMEEFGLRVIFAHHSDNEDVLVLEYPGPNQVATNTGEKGKA